MENEFQSEEGGYVESPLEGEGGGEPTTQQTDESLQTPEADRLADGGIALDIGTAPAAPVAETKPAARPVQAPYAGIQTPDSAIFNDAERASLNAVQEYTGVDIAQIIEGAVTRAVSAERQHNEQRVHAAIQSFEGQQQYARENGIPDSYIPDVRRYSNSVPENLRGTPQGARMALMMGLYDRAEASGGDINTELENYLKVARPQAPAPAPAAPPRVGTNPKPLSNEAQVTRSAITSAPAPAGNGARGQQRDTFFDHFAHLKPYAEE